MRIKTLNEASSIFELIDNTDDILGGKAIDMSEGNWYFDPANKVVNFDDDMFLNAGYFKNDVGMIGLDGYIGYYDQFKYTDRMGNFINVAFSPIGLSGYDPTSGYVFINQNNLVKWGEDEHNNSVYSLNVDTGNNGNNYYSGYLCFNDKSNKSLYSENEYVSGNSGYSITSVNPYPNSGGNIIYSYDTTTRVLVEIYKDVYFDNLLPAYLDHYKDPLIKVFSSTGLTTSYRPSKAIFGDLSEYVYGLTYWKAYTQYANDPNQTGPFISPLKKELMKVFPNLYTSTSTQSFASDFSNFGDFYRSLADKLFNSSNNSYVNSYSLAERSTILQMIQTIFLDSDENWQTFVNYVEKWDGNKKL